MLDAHRIDWQASVSAATVVTTRLGTAEKVALFRRLFRGRTDVYPVRLRMWDRRQRGYQAMGYRVPALAAGERLDFDEPRSHDEGVRATEGVVDWVAKD